MGPAEGRSVAPGVIPMWTARWVLLLPLREECAHLRFQVLLTSKAKRDLETTKQAGIGRTHR